VPEKRFWPGHKLINSGGSGSTDHFELFMLFVANEKKSF
jgi:hypothetical protein